MPDLRQSTPGDEDENRHVHFGYVKTPPERQWYAHLAGPPVWFQCHSKGKTKPCLLHTTNGALACPQCEVETPREETGYVPLWREMDGKPCCVIVHPTVREMVDSIPVHRRVMVGRGEDDHDGVYILPALKPEPRFHSSAAWKLRHADLVPTLLKLWKIPELVAWVTGGTAVLSRGCNTPTDKKPAPGRQGRAPVPLERVDEADPLDDVNREFLRQLQSRSTNGNGLHVHKPGE